MRENAHVKRINAHGLRPVKEAKMRTMTEGDSVEKKMILDLVRTMLERTGLKPSQLAHKAGIAPSTLNKQFDGTAPNILSVTTLMKLSQASGVPIPWLPAGSGSVRDVPIISWVEAGKMTQTPSAMGPDVAKTIPIKSNRETLFGLRVSGDSMNLIAPPGSTIIVDHDDRTLIDRKYYVFRLDDSATVKQYRAAPDRLEPVSSNPEHDTIFPESGLEVIGRVLHIVIDV